MKFYQENKINPLASCLPLLLQLPVFISLFYMLRTDLKLRHLRPAAAVYYSNELNRPIIKNSQIPEHAVNVMGRPSRRSRNSAAARCSAPASAKFLFIPDITTKATGAALIVLIVLYVGSQLGSTLMATATADPTSAG